MDVRIFTLEQSLFFLVMFEVDIKSSAKSGQGALQKNESCLSLIKLDRHCGVCVCVSQTLFQREVNLCLESVHDVHAGGHRKPIELCPTKLSMVSSGYQG